MPTDRGRVAVRQPEAHAQRLRCGPGGTSMASCAQRTPKPNARPTRRLPVRGGHARAALRPPRLPPAARAAARDFAVWAPERRNRSRVIGDWNGWRAKPTALASRGDGSASGKATPPTPQRGRPTSTASSRHGGYVVDKADPFAVLRRAAARPRRRASGRSTTSGATRDWMAARAPQQRARRADVRSTRCTSGSWRRKDGQLLGYRELAHAAGRLRGARWASRTSS